MKQMASIQQHLLNCVEFNLHLQVRDGELPALFQGHTANHAAKECHLRKIKNRWVWQWVQCGLEAYKLAQPT